ncbi:MAG: MBL fold metallo-hydrolase [Erysipelotrichaceae bacterium]|nr:MBL fold metallo-hydrolase [Erysipelotrichaceae bacterium]
MKVTWYGTASILIETSDTSLLFDPYMKYLPKNYESPEVKQERQNIFQNQKHILINHGHLDHLSSINELYHGLNCQIYLTKTPYHTLQSQGFSKDKLYLIKPNDILKFSNTIVKSYYGKRIQLMGSADLDDYVDYPINADDLILPHQGQSDIDAHNQKIVIILKPKRVLLDHYDNAFPPISSDVAVDDFCNMMSKIIPTEKLIERKTITIT